MAPNAKATVDSAFISVTPMKAEATSCRPHLPRGRHVGVPAIIAICSQTVLKCMDGHVL